MVPFLSDFLDSCNKPAGERLPAGLFVSFPHSHIRKDLLTKVKPQNEFLEQAKKV